MMEFPRWNLGENEEILVAEIKSIRTFLCEDVEKLCTVLHLDLSNGCCCTKTRDTIELMKILEVKNIEDIVGQKVFVRNNGGILMRDMCNIMYPSRGFSD